MGVARRFLFGLLLCAFLGGFVGSCSKKDQIISVEDDDQEMAAAIAKARESLPKFWGVFEQRKGGESDFALKVKITDKHGTEHFWLTDIERHDGEIRGTINNDPNTVRSVKLGDRIPIPEADISDWLFKREDKVVGNYTLRVLFKKMPAKEVEQYKRMMADP